MPKAKSAKVVKLQKVRAAKPYLMPDGTPVPPWMIYEPPALYLRDPHRVIMFPVKGSVAPNKL